LTWNEDNHALEYDNAELDKVIRLVKEEFRNIFAKRKDLIMKLGEAFKQRVSNIEDVCEEIKNALREEIAEGIISNRDIERYCPDKWKKNTKPKKENNDNLSFSRLEQQDTPELLVCTDGNLITEPAGISDHETNNPSNDIVTCGGSAKAEVNCIDGCPVRNELETALRESTSFTTADKQLSSQQDKVKELEMKIGRLEQEIKSRAAENRDLIMQEDLKLKLEHNSHSQISEDRFFDVKFRVSYDDLSIYIRSSSSKNNEVDNVIFAATVDVVNRKLVDIHIG
jgi:hypothetical protein